MDFPRPDFIDASDLRASKESLAIIDVRSEEERERYGSIPNSIHVPSELFEDDDGVDAVQAHAQGKTTIVFHCQYSQQRGPFCAQRYCAAMTAHDDKAGEVRVLILRGGFRAWRSSATAARN